MLRAGFFCPDERFEMPLSKTPHEWGEDDAREFLHRLQVAAVTPERPLAWIERIRVHETKRPNVIALEVASNSGVVLTEPMRLSVVAMDWLERAQFDE